MSDVLTLTDAAREKIAEVRDAEDDAETLALWFEVSGEANGSYSYEMYFKRADEASPADEHLDLEGLQLVVPADSVDRIRGARLDFTPTGMVVNNPNHPHVEAEPALPESATLDSDVARAALTVLEEQINPAIASHGGAAELVGVDASIAYIRLSGGCQGCAMSTATLREGIEVALIENVEGIAEVVDVTDHMSGANPYYASA